MERAQQGGVLVREHRERPRFVLHSTEELMALAARIQGCGERPLFQPESIREAGGPAERRSKEGAEEESSAHERRDRIARHRRGRRKRAAHTKEETGLPGIPSTSASAAGASDAAGRASRPAKTGIPGFTATRWNHSSHLPAPLARGGAERKRGRGRIPIAPSAPGPPPVVTRIRSGAAAARP